MKDNGIELAIARLIWPGRWRDIDIEAMCSVIKSIAKAH